MTLTTTKSEALRADRLPTMMPSSLGIIIGAMKSGTTSLYDYLVEHPEIAGCRTKEPFYLSRSDYNQSGLDGYAALWDWDPTRYKIALEASTSYTKLPYEVNAAERLHRWTDGLHPFECRFIYIMRHPVKRIQSHLVHCAASNTTGAANLRRKVMDDALAFSDYARQLDPYCEIFGRDRLLLIAFEEMLQDPKAVVQRCFEFLDVDPAFIPVSVGSKKNEGWWYRDQVRPKLHHRVRLLPGYHLIKQVVPAKCRDFIGHKLQGRELQRVKLTPKEEAQISSELACRMRRLEAKYGFPVYQWWGL